MLHYHYAISAHIYLLTVSFNGSKTVGPQTPNYLMQFFEEQSFGYCCHLKKTYRMNNI